MKTALAKLTAMPQRAVQAVYPYLPTDYTHNAQKWFCRLNAVGDAMLILSGGFAGQGVTDSFARAAGASTGLGVSLMGSFGRSVNRRTLGWAMMGIGASYTVAGVASKRYGEIGNGVILSTSGAILAFDPDEARAWRNSNLFGALGLVSGVVHVHEASEQNDLFVLAAGTAFTAAGITGMVRAEAIERGDTATEEVEQPQPQMR